MTRDSGSGTILVFVGRQLFTLHQTQNFPMRFISALKFAMLIRLLILFQRSNFVCDVVGLNRSLEERLRFLVLLALLSGTTVERTSFITTSFTLAMVGTASISTPSRFLLQFDANRSAHATVRSRTFHFVNCSASTIASVAEISWNCRLPRTSSGTFGVMCSGQLSSVW